VVELAKHDISANINIIKIILFILLFAIAPVWAADSIAPKLDIGKGGQCVEDPQWMRKNHMQPAQAPARRNIAQKACADEKISLKNCIECHASSKDDSVIARDDSFCVGCHRYEAVKNRRFECHSGKRKSAWLQRDAK